MFSKSTRKRFDSWKTSNLEIWKFWSKKRIYYTELQNNVLETNTWKCSKYSHQSNEGKIVMAALQTPHKCNSSSPWIKDTLKQCGKFYDFTAKSSYSPELYAIMQWPHCDFQETFWFMNVKKVKVYFDVLLESCKRILLVLTTVVLESNKNKHICHKFQQKHWMIPALTDFEKVMIDQAKNDGTLHTKDY